MNSLTKKFRDSLLFILLVIASNARKNLEPATLDPLNMQKNLRFAKGGTLRAAGDWRGGVTLDSTLYVPQGVPHMPR